ncbi:phosphoglycerate dehydrogenase [Puniceicoccaceae bacterium K14]|nr:phosphoglycerate dehydrogenase [Puniceicoccaceae bacterium K14]
MKILVADKISPIGVEFLRKQEGFEVIEAYGSSPEKILELSKDVSAIIVRSDTKVPREVIENAPNLKAVGRAGVGVDNIDIQAATDNGVVVMNTPGGNTVATAELTFTHMLCGARPVSQASQSMREGRWDRKIYGGSELRNKTLGICGMGRIGAEVAKRAQAFDMNVVGYDPYLTEARAETLGIKQVELAELFKVADYITVHMPLTDSTRYMIDEAAIETMKDGVRLFNCARGGIIKEDALLAAVQSGKVAAAGLDVYESEPLAEDHPFRGEKNIVLTPHLGASTAEAQESVGVEIAETISAVLKTGSISNAINMPSLDAKTIEKVGPYLDLCSKLGSLAHQIALEKVEKLKISYFGKIVDLDANSLTRGILKGFLTDVSANVNFVNAFSVMENLGLSSEIVKSSTETDYTELIRIEAFYGNGDKVSVEGTLIGNSKSPRVVNINGREIEVEPTGDLLVIANHDELGIVGQVGTVIGKDGVNIAGMSLSRNEIGGVALNIVALDSPLSDSALKEISDISAIKQAKLVHL